MIGGISAFFLVINKDLDCHTLYIGKPIFSKMETSLGSLPFSRYIGQIFHKKTLK